MISLYYIVAYLYYKKTFTLFTIEDHQGRMSGSGAGAGEREKRERVGRRKKKIYKRTNWN